MAFTKAAVLRSMFFYKAVFITSSVADDMISSSPAYTMSNSRAPSRRRDRSNLSLLSPVALWITSSKLFLVFYYHFRVILPGLTWSKFLSHSKQLTVTPPALHRISGKNCTPFFSNISQPSTVVGPLAAQTISLAWNLLALFLLMLFQSAAGIKKSLYKIVCTIANKLLIHLSIVYCLDNLLLREFKTVFCTSGEHLD